MELALIILTVVVLTVVFAAALSVILAIRTEEPREKTFDPIVEDEGGPLVHGGGLGDLRSSRQPTPKEPNGY